MNGNDAQLDLSVIIPCYNEEDRIAPTLDTLRRWVETRGDATELVFVDDGSADGTGAVLERFCSDCRMARCIRYLPNRGKGYAIRTGVQAARGRRILFSDADLSVPIEETDAFLSCLDKGADVAIGSRYLPESRVLVRQPRYRVLWSRLGSAWIQWLLLKGVRDVYCGFKAFTSESAKTLFSVQRRTGLTFDIEVLALAKHYGYKIAEVPVTWKDDCRSRLSPHKEAYRGMRDLLLIKLDELRGWPQCSRTDCAPAPSEAERSV